tara:strand:+ start:6693 stop:8111 length:1419 start_codon:yes stop_codon:yes gene_type:complete
MATPLRTPGSTRTRALGFTHDSDSDDDFVLDGVSASKWMSGRFGYSAGVSSASRIRSRELAAARTFREASREKATLKQHCDVLEEKVRALEESLSETVSGSVKKARLMENEKENESESHTREAEFAVLAAEISRLKSELTSATEDHEWLRSALEAKNAANEKSERERQQLTAKVTELQQIVDESEACLRDSQIEREAHKLRYKKKAAAATAQRLAAEATSAMLKGEVARVKSQIRRNVSMSRLSVHTVDCMTSPTPPSGVVFNEDASDVNEDETIDLKPEVSSMTTGSASMKDDSAMCNGTSDDGSETVTKPLRSKQLELTSPAVAIVFEYTPDNKPETQSVEVSDDVNTSKSWSRVEFGGFDGLEWVNMLNMLLACVQFMVLQAQMVSKNAANARRGNWSVKNVASNVVFATVVTAFVFSSMCALSCDPPGLSFAVRMGSVPLPQKNSFSLFSWLGEMLGLRTRGGLGVAV